MFLPMEFFMASPPCIQKLLKMLSNKNYLFVNGININHGGAGKGSFNFWISDIQNHHSLSTININPPFFNSSKSRFNQNLFYSFLHLPGSILRVFNNPLFEFFNKISIFYILFFLIRTSRTPYSSVIFSHHSSFYLQFLVPYKKRILVVHDILYERAKSFGAKKIIQKFIFSIELIFYRHSRLILIQSYREYRIIKSFLGEDKCFLIKSYPVNNKIVKFDYNLSETKHFAVVADWRRRENIGGLLKFFAKPSLADRMVKNITIDIWGYASDVALNKIQNITKGDPSINFVNKGSFVSYKQVNAPIILILIYQGAGIKFKLLEALNNCKLVFSTPMGLKGLPIIKSKLIYKIDHIIDLRKKAVKASEKDYESFLLFYKKNFVDFARALD